MHNSQEFTDIIGALSLLEHNKLRNPFVDGNVDKVIKPLEKVLKEFDTKKF